MANPNAPFGFADSHRLGAAMNAQMATRWISASYPTQIFTGDPVIQFSDGTIHLAAPGANQVSGIFYGCEYMSISQKKYIAVPFWPGSDAVVSGSGFDVRAKIVDDPLTVFRVQCNGASPATLAQVGLNATWAAGTGNTVSGRSGATLDLVTTPPAATAGLPFRIIDLIRDPPGAPGADPTTPFNWVYVTFNQQDFKAGVAGI